MASFTYSAIGNKMDWSDIITNIDPSETPLYSAFGRGRARAMVHSWLNDHLAVPGANSHLENANLVLGQATPRILLQNSIQIFQKGYYVTESQEAVDKIGITSELALNAA